MDNHWIDTLRRRFASRQVTPPDGLWDSVEAALAGRRRRRARTLAFWRAASVAACVAAVVAVGWHFMGSGHRAGHVVMPSPGRAEQGQTAMLAVDARPIGGRVSHAKVSRLAEAVRVSGVGQGIASVDTVVQAETVDTFAPAPAIAEADGSRRTDSPVTTVREKASSRQGNHYAPQGGLLAFGGAKGSGGGRVSVSVYGTGLSVFGNGDGRSQSASMPYYLSQDAVIEPGFRLLSEVYPSTTEVAEVNVKHRQPVRVGASVRFRFADRFGLETGVNYSYHSSDISSGDDASGYKTEQKLHFVGVPLNVSYNVWRNDYIEVYLSAGGAVDFCVSGEAHTEYVSDREIVRTTDEDVRDSRPQWSVNAAAGVQYDFTPFVGVYLEPGVSYYFDNGSSVKTIYKDKPFNFNLNVGLRFSFNK